MLEIPKGGLHPPTAHKYYIPPAILLGVVVYTELGADVVILHGYCLSEGVCCTHAHAHTLFMNPHARVCKGILVFMW